MLGRRTQIVVVGTAVVAGLVIAWWLRQRGAAGERVASEAVHAKPAADERRSPELPRAPLSPAATSHAVASLGRDPTLPDYDAARLFAVRGRDAAGVFHAEPRDEAWAKPRETQIEDFAAPAFQHIDPDARLEVECRTGSCRVRLHSKNAYLNMQMAPYPLSCLAAYAEPEWPTPGAEDPVAEIYLIFDEDTRGAGFAARQRGTCEKYRHDWEAGAPRP